VLHGKLDLAGGAMLVGHSRGAKVNSLLAAACSQSCAPRRGIEGRTSRLAQLVCKHGIRAVVNLDPVDLSSFDRDVSVLPLLPSTKTSFLHIGSELGNRSVWGPGADSPPSYLSPSPPRCFLSLLSCPPRPLASLS